MISEQFQKLYEKHEKTLKEMNQLQRSFNSALYHEKWKNSKVIIDKLSGIKSLKTLPFSSADDLKTTWEEYPIEDIILTKNVGLWYCTSGSMGQKKWMAWTYNDFNRSKKEFGEMLLSMLKPDDILMAILLPSPFISGTIPFRILESTGSVGKPVEQINFSPDAVEDGFRLLMRRQPTAFMCTPSLALRMAEEIGENTPRILKRMAEDQKSFKLKLAAAITKVTTVKPKQIFKRLRLGFFVSESLEPYRKAIENQFGLEAYDAYGFTEGFGGGFECKLHNGLHFPSLNVIIEIIPEKELAKEENDPNYVPEAVLLTEAEKGLKGEYVVTDFKEAIPLIRYRLRDMVEVIALDECSCGNISPRMKIHGRTDDIINLGVIRLSTLLIENLLRKKFINGTINIWEVFISRDGFKPKLSLTIESGQVSNEEQFKKEIFESLYSFNIFKAGYDNKLFIFDKIKLVDKLKIEVIGQGKRKKVKYHPDFFKPVKI